MLLLPSAAPLTRTLERALAPEGELSIAPEWLPRCVAIGALGDEDALDDALDPAIDRAALAERLAAAGVPSKAAPLLAGGLADREGVLDLSAGWSGDPSIHDVRFRPMTLFERHALVDVLGDLAQLLPPHRVRIEREPLRSHVGALNHCEHGADGVATIRLLATNGQTLAGRTHALVHELGHALIGVARFDGRSYAAPYGRPDYGPFLDPRSFDRPCDEEALVRALADAWLLRRRAVRWTRTWPGAIDVAGRDLDGDDLADFVRSRLAQGLGLPFAPVRVRRI